MYGRYGRYTHVCLRTAVLFITYYLFIVLRHRGPFGVLSRELGCSVGDWGVYAVRCIRPLHHFVLLCGCCVREMGGVYHEWWLSRELPLLAALVLIYYLLLFSCLRCWTAGGPQFSTHLIRVESGDGTHFSTHWHFAQPCPLHLIIFLTPKKTKPHPTISSST